MAELRTEDVKVIGEWDGEIIWRQKTAEEKAVERLVKLGMRKDQATGTLKIFGHILNTPSNDY